MLSKIERAVVLDASVRRLVREGATPGKAVRDVATENGVDYADVVGAILLVKQEGLQRGERQSLRLDDFVWDYVYQHDNRGRRVAGAGAALA